MREHCYSQDMCWVKFFYWAISIKQENIPGKPSDFWSAGLLCCLVSVFFTSSLRATETEYISRGCAIAIQQAAQRFRLAQLGQGGLPHSKDVNRSDYVDSSLGSYPDWILLDYDDVQHARLLYQKKWELMYGTHHSVSSPSNSVTPMSELKIGSTITTKGNSILAIPTEIINRQNNLDEANEPRARELAAKLDMYVEQLEAQEGQTYQPEPVVRVASAVNRIKENTALAGVEGLLRPLLELVQESLDDYLSILDISIEVDRLQFEINSEVTNLANRGALPLFHGDGVESYNHSPLFNLLLSMDAFTFSDRVRPWTKEMLEMLSELAEDRSIMGQAERSYLISRLRELTRWQDRLKRARENYSNTYPAGIMSYFFITLLGKPDGFSEVETNNFVRASWIKTLTGKNRLWVLLGVKLLSQRNIIQRATDELIDLKELSPTQIIEKYLNDPRLHEMVAGLLLCKGNLDIEFEADRSTTLPQAIHALEIRLGAAGIAKAEKRLRKGAVSTVQHVLNLPFSRQNFPEPAIKVLLETLEETEQESGLFKTNPITLPQIRELPVNFPAYLTRTTYAYDRVRPLGNSSKLSNDIKPLQQDPVQGNAKPEDISDPTSVATSSSMPVSTGLQTGAEVFQYLLDELLNLDHRAQLLFKQDIEFQRQTIKPELPTVQLSAKTHSEIKQLQRDRVEIARRIMSVLHALELSLIEGQRVQITEQASSKIHKLAQNANQAEVDVQKARADARATLAYHIVDHAPSLARLAIHENSLSAIKGFQRRLVIEMIKAILDNPEEVARALSDAQGDRFRSLRFVQSSMVKNRWKIVAWSSVLGVGAIAGWLGWHWWVDEVSSPVEVKAGDSNVETKTSVIKPPMPLSKSQ